MGKDNQEFLKKLEHISQVGSRIMHWAIVVLYAAFTCVIFTATIYYAMREFQGSNNPRQLTICSTMLLILAAIPICSKLVDCFITHLSQKNDAFDPRMMELPAFGTVSLEDALHKMSTQTGVIVWDTLWGCVACGLLSLVVFDVEHRPYILLACAGVIGLITIGHAAFYLMWKKRSFAKKMLCNTSKIIELSHPEAYFEEIEKSLKQGVLSYEKELILTNKYILGSTEWGTHYTPVAIPRGQITEFVFFYQQTVGNINSWTVGILRCIADGKILVDFVLGSHAKVEKIKKILDYYQISWREEELFYV